MGTGTGTGTETEMGTGKETEMRTGTERERGRRNFKHLERSRVEQLVINKTLTAKIILRTS